MDLSTLKIDTEGKAVEGVWFDYGEGCRLLIARLGNRKFADYHRRLLKRHQHLVDTGRMPLDLSRKLFAESCANTVLLGWEGITEGPDELPYSVEKAQEILADPKYEVFANDVMEFARGLEAFRAEGVAESGKVSKKH